MRKTELEQRSRYRSMNFYETLCRLGERDVDHRSLFATEFLDQMQRFLCRDWPG